MSRLLRRDLRNWTNIRKAPAFSLHTVRTPYQIGVSSDATVPTTVGTMTYIMGVEHVQGLRMLTYWLRCQVKALWEAFRR